MKVYMVVANKLHIGSRLQVRGFKYTNTEYLHRISTTTVGDVMVKT